MGILVMVAITFFMFDLAAIMYFKNIYLSGLKNKYDTVHQQIKGLEKEHVRNMSVRNYLSGQCHSINLLVEMITAAPEGIEINDILYDSQSPGRFVLKGIADSMSDVFTFVDQLSKSKYLKEVRTKQTTKRKEGKREVVYFEITSIFK